MAYAARRAASVEEAVSIVDRAAAADLVSLEELSRLRATDLAGHRAVQLLEEVVGLADENSWSPMETRMRLLWHGLGITHVVCNRPVFSIDGEHLGTPDLLDLEAGVAGEYDGPAHLAGAQRARDIRREARFRRAGLE